MRQQGRSCICPIFQRHVFYQNSNEAIFADMGFRAEQLDSEEEALDNDPEARKRKALKLTEALAVLAIRPPQFDSLSRAGKLDMVSGTVCFYRFYVGWQKNHE